ncbi:MAG TPA: dihydroxyacetone kinase subunit DhaL [Dongiaceae bacterium]
MKLDTETKDRLIAAMAQAIASHAGELTDLDRAIGDGDHGSNMKRGFDAVLADRANLASKPLPDMLKALGTHLVMTIGGASGPLYGTLFMALGKDIPAEPSLADAARAFAAAVNAVKARGKATTGEKTMLEVLQPVVDVLQASVSNPAGLGDRVKAAADAGLESTKPMKASKGRASFLGERSIGHLDPGARSSQLLAHAVIGVLAAQPALEGGRLS